MMRKVRYLPYKSDKVFEAHFHQWAQDHDGEGNSVPVAIIEYANGRIDCVYAWHITFVNDGEQPADERKDAWDSKDAKIERLTDPKYLCHRGNRISLSCGTSAIALFVSRAIANKDAERPSPEKIAEFRAALDAAVEKGSQA